MKNLAIFEIEYSSVQEGSFEEIDSTQLSGEHLHIFVFFLVKHVLRINFKSNFATMILFTLLLL